ncbi:methyltransferase [Amycolatopsis vastitatis]|uniref:Uncharacterized protein n=1 Tax=Amycolatopsis vastitatis TaxID=1905142 RepID=A0A229T3T4_9PSEU|nr:methyltransferase [Amycolatopsis vastitatis]OXM65916.1 hypothetical protein CF165_21285 [Amycolatopsis vastitatis]
MPDTPDIQRESAFVRMVELTDTVAPWAIRTAATLGLADLVAPGGTSLEGLLKGLGEAGEQVDSDALRRLMHYLVTIGIFTIDAGPGTFRRTPLAELMVSDNPVGMREWWLMNNAMAKLDQATVLMIDAVRTGEPAYEKLFGRDVWTDLAQDPNLSASFEKAMAHKTRISLASIVEAFPWPSARNLVDVGGGHGLLLEAVLREAPEAVGTVFDTAAGIATARAHLAKSDVADRARFAEGTFFGRWPEGADTYVVMNVLHNWPDDDVVRILGRGSEVLGPDSRILVVETVVGGDGDQASLARLDLMMLIFSGGKERSFAEYSELAGRAGLTIVDTHPTSFGLALLELRRKEVR